MRFADRQEAGAKLAEALDSYRDRQDTVVIGLARGGVAVAFEIAKKLALALDVCVVRKIRTPDNEELALGAVTETGGLYLNEMLIASFKISAEYLRTEISCQQEAAQKRAALYRKKKRPCDVQGKIVIVVDDGIATGATMHAALSMMREQGAKKIVLAVPVAPADELKEFQQDVSRIVCLYTPLNFLAVGQFYDDFSQVDDAQVAGMLQD